VMPGSPPARAGLARGFLVNALDPQEAALRQGGAPPVDPHDAVVTLRVLEAARESAAARQTVAFAGQSHDEARS
jgi:predicted dehydrogenase